MHMPLLQGAVLPHSQRPGQGGVMQLGGMRQRARAWVAPPADALAALVLEGELWAASALRLGAMKKAMMIQEAKETCPETGGAIVLAVAGRICRATDERVDRLGRLRA